MSKPNWQLVIISWGAKYSVRDINRLHDAARRNSPTMIRTVLITDRNHNGLRQEIETREFPVPFRDKALRGAGCQAKLCMFSKGVVPEDVPAVFCDLDSAIFGDLSEILEAQSDRELGVLQSTLLPANTIVRLLHTLSARRIYARGNSSIVAYHPKFHTDIPEQFLRLNAGHDLGHNPLRADERFMSWSAQKHLRFINRRQAVKFTREFMGRSIGEVRAKALLPSTIDRRKGLIFVTFNQEVIKPSRLIEYADGERIIDSKGRVSEWSRAALGESKDLFKRYFEADTSIEI